MNWALLAIAIMLAPSTLMAESLRNLSTQYCLDTDGNAVNGGVVRMWQCAKHPNQEWTEQKAEEKFSYGPISGGVPAIQFRNHSSNFCLDTDGARTNGALVRMWQCVAHPNQLWEIQILGNGHSRLRNRASNFCLDTDGRAENGALVRMWECVQHPNQTWARAVPID